MLITADNFTADLVLLGYYFSVRKDLRNHLIDSLVLLYENSGQIHSFNTSPQEAETSLVSISSKFLANQDYTFPPIAKYHPTVLFVILGYLGPWEY